MSSMRSLPLIQLSIQFNEFQAIVVKEDINNNDLQIQVDEVPSHDDTVNIINVPRAAASSRDDVILSSTSTSNNSPLPSVQLQQHQPSATLYTNDVNNQFLNHCTCIHCPVHRRFLSDASPSSAFRSSFNALPTSSPSLPSASPTSYSLQSIVPIVASQGSPSSYPITSAVNLDSDTHSNVHVRVNNNNSDSMKHYLRRSSTVIINKSTSIDLDTNRVMLSARPMEPLFQPNRFNAFMFTQTGRRRFIIFTCVFLLLGMLDVLVIESTITLLSSCITIIVCIIGLGVIFLIASSWFDKRCLKNLWRRWDTLFLFSQEVAIVCVDMYISYDESITTLDDDRQAVLDLITSALGHACFTLIFAA